MKQLQLDLSARLEISRLDIRLCGWIGGQNGSDREELRAIRHSGLGEYRPIRVCHGGPLPKNRLVKARGTGMAIALPHDEPLHTRTDLPTRVLRQR
jgi:hypothetical protein